MRFETPLEPATLLRRYKRFLADVRFADGSETTAHCANPGSMMGVAPEGAACWLSRSKNKARKLPLSLELIECPSPTQGQTLVGINTGHPNKLAVEAIEAGLVEGLDPSAPLEKEVRYGEEKSRIDLLQRGPRDLYIEVKNCTLHRRADGVAEFPDSVTARGLKHLRELVRMQEQGADAMLLFIAQRTDAEAVAPAADLDPKYAEGLAWAAEQGVTMRAVVCDLSPEAITPRAAIPVLTQT